MDLSVVSSTPAATRRQVLVGLTGWMLSSTSAASSAPATVEHHMNAILPVVELRQYTIKEGRRAEFIQLFREHFVVTQEAEGIRVLGSFEDLDDPDRFVWIRGFSSMSERPTALAAFYGGAAWKARRQLANSMIVDSDNVLLLCPCEDDAAPSGLRVRGVPSITVAIQYLPPSVEPRTFARLFRERIVDRVDASGGELLGTLCTFDGANNFPPLPVRSGERAFLWFVGFPGREAQERFDRRFAAASGWRDNVPEDLLPSLMRKPELLHLQA